MTRPRTRPRTRRTAAGTSGPRDVAVVVPGLRAGENAWMRHAACVGHEALPWTDTVRPHPLLVDAMARICRECPVRAECAAYAVRVQATAGWWAGHSLNGYDLHHPPTTEAFAREADGEWGGEAA